MTKVSFRAPDGTVLVDPNRELLKKAIVELPSDYWRSVEGTGLLSRSKDGQPVELFIFPNLEIGRIYLKYVGGDETWLSLADSARLEEVIECDEEWYASVGLFLLPGQAWVAVDHFLETGERSPEVPWIQPSQMPAEGNW